MAGKGGYSPCEKRSLQATHEETKERVVIEEGKALSSDNALG